MRTLLLGFSLLGLALAAPAQSSYFFGDNNPATGGGNVIPFGNGTTGTWQNQRAQFLVSPQFLPAMPRPLTAIGFTSTGGGNYLFQGVQIQLGHNTAGVLGSLLMGNFVTPPITVFNRANFSWNVTVNTWCRIPLDRPFIYNGKDHLVVDVTVHGSHLNPKSSFRTAGQPRTYNTNYTIQGGLSLFGSGCKGSNGKAPAMLPIGYPLIGAQLFGVGLQDALPSTGAFLLLGTSNTAWFGLPLPWDLGFTGAAGCKLNVSVTTMIAAQTLAAGDATVRMSIPADSALAGARIYFQWLAADAAAPGAFTTSDGMEALLLEPSAPTMQGQDQTAALKMELVL